tara:strand:- start:517 stop:1032 length:516 start_codon:yes stop_codon:yes gene_type:complete
MFDIISFANTTPLLLFLCITILTNFIGDIMGCKIQKIFTQNIILKYCIMLFVIYTTIVLVDKKTSPKEHFIKSIYILILFLLFTKNTFRITTIIIIFMIILFITEDYINYYKNIKNEERIKKLTKISIYLKYIILFLIIVGHILYIIKQKKKFGNDFNIIKLYRGTKCTII